MPTPFTPKPTLKGDLITLRPIRATDADLIDRIINEDPDIAKLTGAVHSSTEKLHAPPIENLRETYGSWAQAEDRLALGIIDNATGELVGEAILLDWEEGNHSCAFRILIGKAGRGRGLGTEATQLAVNYGLQEMGLHRIRLEVYDFNPRARRVYEKVGFVYEGTSREALRFDDRWIDMHNMAILASD